MFSILILKSFILFTTFWKLIMLEDHRDHMISLLYFHENNKYHRGKKYICPEILATIYIMHCIAIDELVDTLMFTFDMYVIFRQLRSQRRIRLHICLFFSFILKCLTTILWDLLVYNDRLDNPTTTSRMNQNTVFLNYNIL